MQPNGFNQLLNRRIPHLFKTLRCVRHIVRAPQSNQKLKNPEKIQADPKPKVSLKERRIKKTGRIKLKLLAFGTAISCIGLTIILGAPEVSSCGEPIKDDLTNENLIKQYITRTYREMRFYVELLQVPLNEKLLPDPLDYPYVQPKYTLVLELADVLVHLDCTYIGNCRFKKRPLLDHFLHTLRESYEIIIYTAEEGKVVFSVVDIIDPDNIIAYKLIRGTTDFTRTGHVKKINSLNRNLTKVICVDWNDKHLKLNPENLLRVKRWEGNDDDKSLLDLAMFLKTIADNDIEDVREVLKYYSKYEDPIEAYKKKQEELIKELEEQAAEKKVDTRSKILSMFKL
ncbi:hypothetical protein NQ317_012075 [Molorchus minor]|uniref:Mitochondrial import inner membrane translocase subunit TIM50 n=1 Tax=Molorchus minor TaxID=1323400 RepID=A0ABQ9K6A7_9CUCU|nr:hypothetical protein NQ317_012075 [Molorchus minor]